jgi:programmed cell death protein 5
MRQLLQEQAQQQIQGQLQEQLKAEEINAQIKLILSKLMEPDARERLANIRLVKPDFARQVEILLIQMYQTGRLKGRMDDKTFKDLLEKIRGSRREGRITKK